MNDLIITTNNFTPAKVEFNYQQIADQLEIVLAKYKGLVFTEETAADCKKTITELRKGKKSVEDFRKETDQTVGYTQKEVWMAYDGFNKTFLDSNKYI